MLSPSHSFTQSNLISLSGVDFVTKLLEREPSIRLTLKNALAHPWLKGHEPVYLRTLRPDNSVFILRNTILDTIWGRPTAATAPLVADVSMSDVGDLLEPPSTIGRPTVGPEPSQASSSGTSNIPGAYPKARSGNGNGPSTPRRENSQLVRRADVLARANDEDVPLPAPPEEMVQREERRRAGGGANGNGNGNGNGRSRATGQRQVDADADMADASNVAVGSKRRTARPPSEDARPSRKRRSPRDNSPMDDGEESPAPRRSTRQRKAT
jgi:serine/threonine protein kinase